MKVLMISKIAPWHPSAGGMENHVYELSNNLKKEGTEIIHIFWENKHSKGKDTNIKYFGIKGKEFLNTFFATQTIYIPKASFHIKEILKKENPDIIHAHGMTAGIIAIIAKEISHIPYIYTMHGFSSEQYKYSTSNLVINGFLEKFANFEECQSVKKSDKVISIGKNIIKLASKKYDISKEKFISIPNGINVDKFCFKKERSANNILFVGRLEKIKGLDTLLEAVALIQNKTFSVHLVGDGDYRQVLINKCNQLKIKNKINFLGKFSERKLIELYSQADIFVLPSVYEAFGIVILEAMASNLPVIASDVGGISEVVKDKDTGLLVPPRDPRALADAINSLLEDKKLRTRLGIAGRKRAEKYFDWETIAKKTLEVYKSVI